MLTISRNYYHRCTTGEAVYKGFTCKTLELQWLRNQQNISCIPEGIYQCHKIVSPSLGECFEIENVPNRTFIRGHMGNFTSDILGCILFGESLLDFNGDGITDVTNSKETFTELMAILPDKFMIEVA